MPLGTVSQHQQWLKQSKLDRKRNLLMALANPSSKKEVAHPLRLLATRAVQVGVHEALQMFRPLTLVERRALFERDVTSVGLMTPEQLLEADKPSRSESAVIIASRKESNVGCECAFLSGEEAMDLGPKRLKAALAAAGLPATGDKASQVMRLLRASRERAGCMRHAPLPEANVAAGKVTVEGRPLAPADSPSAAAAAGNLRVYISAHVTCVSSDHSHASQPLDAAHARGVALAQAESAERAAAASGAPGSATSAGSDAANGSPPASGSAASGSASSSSSSASSASSASSGKATAGSARLPPLVPPAIAVCPCEASGVGCHW